MDFSSIRVLVFFGILFVASFLLWPELFLRALTHQQQLWMVRTLTNRHWTGVKVLTTVVFVVLTAWLVLAKSGAREQAQADLRNDSEIGTSQMLKPFTPQGRP